MSKEKEWTTEYAPRRKMLEAFGPAAPEAGLPSGEELEGVPVFFNPTCEAGKVFCIGVGAHKEELQLHCTEETWRETKADPDAVRANLRMVKTVKAAVNRQKHARIMGTPNWG